MKFKGDTSEASEDIARKLYCCTVGGTNLPPQSAKSCDI